MVDDDITVGKIDEAAKFCVILFMVMFYCASTFAVLCCAQMLIFTRSGWNISKVLHCMITVCLILRSSDLTINFIVSGYEIIIRPPAHQSAWWFVSASLPVYMFFTTYVLVCLFWIYLYKDAYAYTTSIMRQIKIVYLCINIVVYGFWVSIVVGLFEAQPEYHFRIHAVETGFAASISFIAGTLFLVYGSKLYTRLKSLPAKSDPKKRLSKRYKTGKGPSTKKRTIRRVGHLTVICTLVFLIRGCLILFSFFLFRTAFQMLVDNIMWYTMIEFVPSMSILILMYDVRYLSAEDFDDSANP